MKTPLVSVQWLQKNSSNENLVILDASMDKVIGKEPIVYDEFSCIPGAQKMDLEGDFCDTRSAQLHALPTEDQFNAAVRQLGIKASSVIIIYDNQGIYSSPRGWCVFKAMGLGQVYVLDGGLPGWIAAGNNTNTEYGRAGEEHYVRNIQATYNPQLVRTADEVLQNISDSIFKVIDARSSDRFYGIAPEPRPGVRGGHIPGSSSMPFLEVLDGDKFKTSQQLEELFSNAGGIQQQLVFSCGSGITACIILLAAVIAGYQRVSLYDGSWAEWGGDNRFAVETTGS